MNLNTNYKQAKDIVLSFLKENKIDNVDICNSFDYIDIFKLGTELGFDIRGAFYPDENDKNTCILLVNEREDKIEKFNSNKVIVYRNFMKLDFTKKVIAYELANYIFEKKINKIDILVMGNRYNQEQANKNVMISIIASTIISPLTYADSDIKINYNSSKKNETTKKAKVTNKTYLTPSGKDIRDSKMPGTYEIHISETNERIANERIKEAERINAEAVRDAQFHFARELRKK